jgi:alpha/beta superfamily hydrolase
VVDPQAVFDWIDALEHKPELVRMPDTSHFFHRRLMDLRGAIKHAVLGWLPPPRHERNLLPPLHELTAP